MILIVVQFKKYNNGKATHFKSSGRVQILGNCKSTLKSISILGLDHPAKHVVKRSYTLNKNTNICFRSHFTWIEMKWSLLINKQKSYIALNLVHKINVSLPLGWNNPPTQQMSPIKLRIKGHDKITGVPDWGVHYEAWLVDPRDMFSRKSRLSVSQRWLSFNLARSLW